MSRIGKKPLPIPSNVEVTIEGGEVRVKGPKGEMRRDVHPDMTVTMEEGVVVVQRPSDSRQHRSLHGLTRALLGNMVEGVTTGFTRALELHGVGYKAEASSTGIKLLVGYSHPVEYQAPDGVQLTVESPTQVRVAGIDKEKVGQVAAEIRKVRPPEPYKGKGIRYVGEHVRRKAGKTGAKA